jgi:transposase-like protein
MDNLSPTSQPHLRQSYTAAQKIRIVQKSMRPDASIAAVAMSHRINANQLHRWRWLYRNDQLGSRAERLELGSVTGFLPVKLTSSVLAPKPRAAAVVNKPVISSPSLPDSVHVPSHLSLIGAMGPPVIVNMEPLVIEIMEPMADRNYRATRDRNYGASLQG